jgi:hypothetical protein
MVGEEEEQTLGVDHNDIHHKWPEVCIPIHGDAISSLAHPFSAKEAEGS